MNGLMSLILAVIMCFMGTVNCFIGGGETPEEPPRTVTLRYSSFSGGGYEYSAEIDDPEILSFRSYRDYGDTEGEIPPGAGFDEVFIFEGVKPGRTRVTIHAYSPLMEDRDETYEADVDEGLNVTLSSEKTISRLQLYRYGSEKPRSYELIILEGEYRLSADGGAFRRSIDASAAEELKRIVEEYDLASWDGFDGRRSGVLDGEGFRLDIWFSDGTQIHAQGDNAFPANYFDAINGLEDILADARG